MSINFKIDKIKIMDILYIIILLLGLFLIFVGYFSNVIAPILSGVAFILILIIKRYERY